MDSAIGSNLGAIVCSDGVNTLNLTYNPVVDDAVTANSDGSALILAIAGGEEDDLATRGGEEDTNNGDAAVHVGKRIGGSATRGGVVVAVESKEERVK